MRIGVLSVVLTIACSTGGLVGGAGRLGSTCRAAGTDPLQVSADAHWLEFRGQKTLLIGDSVTQGWMELGTNFNQAAYLDALAARGINVAMIWTYIGITDQVADTRIGYDAPEIWPWNKAGAQFDLNQLNAAYFDRLRTLVQLADSKNIVILLTIHDGWTKSRFGGHPFNQANGGPLTASSQFVELANYNAEMPTTYNSSWTRQQKHQFFLERFCERIIQTTGDQPNIIYEMFNEGEWYDQSNLRAFQVHFLDFFKARSPRVTMVNDDHVGGAGFRGEADCDVISLHKPNWDVNSSAATFFNTYAAEFAGAPTKPYFFSEPVPEYQGNASLHDAITRMMWGTALGGSGFVMQNDTSFGFDPSAAMASQAVNRDIVLNREGHCARFFNASGVAFWAMSPAGALASTGVCLADPGREYIAYSQAGASSFTVNLSAAAGTFNCRFYNPRSGQFASTFQAAGGATRTFTKPDTSDWALHVVRVLEAPVAVIDAVPTSGTSPLPVAFDASGSYDTDGGTIVAYAWDFESDGVVDATGPTVAHVYQGKVTATAALTVTDNQGHTGAATVQISVATLTADFDGDADVDQEDYAYLQTCYSGSGKTQDDPLCGEALLDEDEDVDEVDFAVFQACVSGPNMPPSCGS